MVCTWILIMKAWKEFSQGSQQFDKAQCKDKQHMCKVFKKSHHKALVGLWHIKEELCKGFSNFQIKFPSTQTLREKIISSNHITNINYLDEHAFLKIFVHKHQDDKYGIKCMCETWVPLGPHWPGSRPSPTSGSGPSEDSPTCQWVRLTWQWAQQTWSVAPKTSKRPYSIRWEDLIRDGDETWSTHQDIGCAAK